MQQLDPYPDIKQEVERELEEAAKLQTDLFAGKNAAAEQLKYQFNNVTEQLSALETAVKLMVDSPERFQLDRTTAYTRQVEVETLRWQLQDLQATCAQVQTAPGANGHSQKEVTFSDVEMHKFPNGDLQQQRVKHNNSGTAPLRHSKLTQQPGRDSSSYHSSRPLDALPTSAAPPAYANSSSSSRHKQSLPVSTPPTSATAAAVDDTRNNWDTGDWDSYEDAMQQQMVQQDQALDHISIHVDRIKQTGQAMHDELEEQTLLLGALESDTDTSHIRLRGLRKKLSDVIKRSRTDRQLCLILALSVLLVVVTLIAIA